MYLLFSVLLSAPRKVAFNLLSHAIAACASARACFTLFLPQISAYLSASLHLRLLSNSNPPSAPSGVTFAIISPALLQAYSCVFSASFSANRAAFSICYRPVCIAASRLCSLDRTACLDACRAACPSLVVPLPCRLSPGPSSRLPNIRLATCPCTYHNTYTAALCCILLLRRIRRFPRRLLRCMLRSLQVSHRAKCAAATAIRIMYLKGRRGALGYFCHT